ncbi:MAG: dTDP-4-dehydrorhamnose reductase family protein [Deltaproteobacteria bacterium]
MERKRVLVLGATGMLGHALFTLLSERGDLDVHGTVRRREGLARWFSGELIARIHGGVNADEIGSVRRALDEASPDVVVNAIGVIKQLPEAQDPVVAISINALFPHRLALACRAAGARLIHVGTDCVFSGVKGNYAEDDFPDAPDLYGRTKLLGEATGPGCLTLRTSLVGHELQGRLGLVEWFLSREEDVQGYSNAVFSGFPTVEFARIVAERVIPNEELAGLYHVSSDPISKYDLLRLLAARYGKRIGIERQEEFRCDRSLDSTRFRRATGYDPPAWPDLVEAMHRNFVASPAYRARVGTA